MKGRPELHECPGPGCAELVSATRLMCRPCWYAVPKPLRDAVWRSWRNGKGAGRADHAAAVADAVEALRKAQA